MPDNPKYTEPIILDGTTEETFASSMNNLLSYMLSLSEQKLDGLPVKCLRCGDASYTHVDGKIYRCPNCGHDTGVIGAVLQ